MLICRPVIPPAAHHPSVSLKKTTSSAKKHICASGLQHRLWSNESSMQRLRRFINNPCTSFLSLRKLAKFQFQRTNNDIPPPSVSEREMHWKVKTLQSLPLCFLSHNRSRKWVSFAPFICAAFPGETVATPPYLCHRRVLQWIMKWIMQMSPQYIHINKG